MADVGQRTELRGAAVAWAGYAEQGLDTNFVWTTLSRSVHLV